MALRRSLAILLLSCMIGCGRKKGLSRHHCLFESVHGDLRLTELASANGTFVNGEELCARTTVLHHNDVITVGSNTDIIVQTARKPRRFFLQSFVSYDMMRPNYGIMRHTKVKKE